MLLRSTVLLLVVVLSACTGPAGPQGQPGEPGPTGPQGPAGTPSESPRIESLAPGWGSARTEVTLLGQNFSAQPADNRVTFDGVSATVVSASANRLVVRPGLATAQTRWVAVSVEVAKQTSNAMAFELVPSGTPRVEQQPLLTSPTSLVKVGADLYVTSGTLLNSTGGLYRIQPDGRITRVVAGRFVTSKSRYEAPQFLTTDGTDIWFTTTFGMVGRYQVATGKVSEVLQLSETLQGIARSAAGTLFISAANSRVHRLSPAGELTTISGSELDGVYSLVADGGDVFAASANDGSVTRISNAEGAYTLTPRFTTTPSAGLGLCLTHGKLVLSAYDGRLFTADRTAGGVMTPYLAPEGYGGFVYGVFADGEGSLYLTQNLLGTVRKIAPGSNASSIIAAGFRHTSATVRLNDRWYFAGVRFPGTDPLPAGLPDGTIVELSDDGVSRVVARGGDIRGLAALEDGRLVFSDCAERKISTLEPTTGAVSQLLGAADGLSCPLGLVPGAGGELLYVDVQATGASVGRRTAQGAHVPSFVTGLPKESVQLARVGNRLLALSPEVTQGMTASLYSADATTGGVAAEWMPAVSMRSITGMGTAPSGEVFFARSNGELLTLDPESRLLSPFGSTLVFPVDPSAPPPSRVLSMGFKPDGTLLMLDAQQYEVVTVAP